ncbi:hypothetical protein Ate01nite_26820 [Actinoplanes teichomyceticus]|nr:hypothetical protein Ate01nite_26820 [Actinoplanes teichomyceticus]
MTICCGSRNTNATAACSMMKIASKRECSCSRTSLPPGYDGVANASRHRAITAPIVRALPTEHLEHARATVELSAETLDRIDEVVSPADPQPNENGWAKPSPQTAAKSR